MKKIIFLIFGIYLFGCNAPFSLDKFKNVLSVSKLQAPGSHYNPLYSTKYGEFKDFCNKYFYLQDNKYMAFFMCGKKHRSELRFKNEWSVADSNPHIIIARVKLFPLNEKREFTFLQIHADSNLKDKPVINKPLLRVVWYKHLRGAKNHIWAVIRACDEANVMCYEKIDLGEMPKGFFDIKVEVKNSKLKIWVNGNLKVDKDVSYWNKFLNYFKAGVYLQDEGCAKVLFDKLTIKE